MRRLPWALLLLLLGATLGHAAEEALKVYFNGQPAKIQTTNVEGGRVVPVYFPVEEGESVFEVRLTYQADLKTLKIERKPIKPKIRGNEACYYCTGSGKCQNCYPAGSGVTASGANCYLCNGSSKCSYCGGSGTK